MLIQVDFYKETGKWYSGGRVKINAKPWKDDVLHQIVENQEIVQGVKNFYIVVSDIPESQNDPNYNITYSRLYSIEKVNQEYNKYIKEK